MKGAGVGPEGEAGCADPMHPCLCVPHSTHPMYLSVRARAMAAGPTALWPQA